MIHPRVAEQGVTLSKLEFELDLEFEAVEALHSNRSNGPEANGIGAHGTIGARSWRRRTSNCSRR